MPIFESSLTYPKMHNWCQFGDPSWNWWWVIAVTRALRTDRQTDGQTDGRTDRRTEVTTIPLRPLRPRGKNSKNCTKNLNIFFTSRWPGAKSAPVHQLAKKLYLRTWGHFKDRTPPHWASKNGEFPDFRLSETHPWTPNNVTVSLKIIIHWLLLQFCDGMYVCVVASQSSKCLK